MTIDLTSAESALAYLKSLAPETEISLPGPHESTIEGDAVQAITGLPANQWANSHRRWDWTARELIAQF